MLPEGGATVDFAPTDESEVFDSLTVAYDDSEGSLYLDLPTVEQGNIRLELPDGAELAFTYRNEGAGRDAVRGRHRDNRERHDSYTLSDQLSLHELTAGGRLHYIPDADSQSDAM